MATSKSSSLDRLITRHSLEVPNLLKARQNTRRKLTELEEAIRESRIISPNTEDESLVVYGSLARQEVTDSSDADWTLLVDSRVNLQLELKAQQCEELFRNAGLRDPGATRTFGTHSVSHDLVYKIGGGGDTNENTTKRILLLLESVAVGPASVHNRVVRSVLEKYLAPENTYHQGEGAKYRVPRILLNDVFRYWRTMTVDFAAKNWQNDGQKWGLRNSKLRFSRKLIFMAGYLACLRVELRQDNESDQSNLDAREFLENVLVRQTPVEIVAETCLLYNVPSDIVRGVFNNYDHFIQVLSDSSARDSLKKLAIADAKQDNVYQSEISGYSTAFHDALESLLFDHEPIKKLNRKYGVL